MNLQDIDKKIYILKQELQDLQTKRYKLLSHKYKCPKCNKFLSNKKRYTEHINNICGKWNCNYCHIVCSSKNYLKKHEAICIKRICPHCKTYRSNRKNVLARHIQQCKLASEQKPDVVSEIKEILPVHHDEPSQLQPVHLSDDDVSQTHLDQSVHNT